MACSYFHNGQYYTEAELEDLYDKDISEFFSGMQSFVPAKEAADKEEEKPSTELLSSNALSKLLYNQKEGLNQSKASPKTISKVKEFLSRNNIKIETLDTQQYEGINGVANILEGLIQVADGQENIALTEEMMHFVADALKQSKPSLYKEMLNKISTYRIYNQTKALYSTDKNYQTKDGSPDIVRIKDEAIAKLLAEYYIKREEGIDDRPEQQLLAKTWWAQLISWIKDLLKIAEFNPFEQTVEEVDTTVLENKLKNYADLIEFKMNSQSSMYTTVVKQNEDGNYRDVVEFIVSQLTTAFDATVEQYLGGDEALGREILAAASPFFQKNGDEFVSNIRNKFKAQIEKFDLQKVVEEASSDDEDSKNYYMALVDGKKQRVGRTTDWAKKKNIEFTKGRDFFADLSAEKKKEYQILADNGTKGHYDIERIIAAATNSDGTLKPREEIKTDFTPALPQSIFNVLQTYLLGNATKQGWLYQFEPSSVFITEQQIFNENAVQTEDGKKIKGRAGTMDLVILTPSKQVIVYDWKFMRMNESDPKYNPLKINQHRLQLSDYKNTLKQAYGIKYKDIKVYTVPIAVHYTTLKNTTTKESKQIFSKITVGEVDVKNEERSFLLPVAPQDQVTENKEVNALLSNLRAKYERIWKRKVADDDWAEKVKDLNTLQDAMRHLQIALNFGPLAIEAKNFEKEAERVIQKYKAFDPLSASKEELQVVFSEIPNTIGASNYYSNLDSIFRSEYGGDNLTPKNAKTLNNLEKSSSVAKDVKTKLLEELRRIVDIIAKKEGINNILSAEKQITGTLNQWIESGNIPSKALQFLTVASVKSRSADEVEVQSLLNQFDPIYQSFIKYAESTGTKEPLSLIANMEKHELFYKIDKTTINAAKTAKNKKAILANVDEAKLKALIKERLDREYKKIDAKIYTEGERANTLRKESQKNLIGRDLNIYRDDFSGWNNRSFNSFIDKSLKEEESYSKEYKTIAAQKPLLDMYNYILDLNERARIAGYLDRNQGRGFIAFVNATMAQRIAKSANKFGAAEESIKDMFTVQEYEEQTYGRKDNETGEIDRSVPAYFTKELDKEKRSTDLFGVIPLYIKSLVHFETSQKLEDFFQSIVLIEENKGHLEVLNNKVVFEADVPKEYTGNNINTKIVKNYMDDQIYGINNQYDDLISRGQSKIGKKENEEKRTLSTKKTIQTLNRWTQQLAVGLKLSVAVPNLIGSGLQAGINAGRYYKGREYPKNWMKIVGSKLGATDDIEKGLLDMFLPLNDDNYKKHLKGIAWKQSTRKYLATTSWQDFMMSFNRIGDVSHQLANALTWLDNTMLDEDGNVVNIRQHLSSKPEYLARYDDPETLREKEKALDVEVEKLKEEKALKKIAKWENDVLVVPGMNKESLAPYRAKIVEYGRTITSQSSRENKAAYQRNILLKSFMMFKNWIVPQVQTRALDIHKNIILGDWEYGRMRLMAKTIAHLGFQKIGKIRAIIKATPEGIAIMREIMEEKIESYYQKTGQKLEITEAEFFDMMRKELQSEAKELELLLTVVSMVWLVGAAQPPDDDGPQSKNAFKFLAKISKKAADELRFYYNPLSAQSILQGSIFPSLGILTKTSKILEHTIRVIDGDEEAYPVKYLINLIPGPSQFQNEFLPIIDPNMAKELGIRTTDAARLLR